MAMLSQRLPLTIVAQQGNTDARELCDNLVARHLRRVGRVSINSDMVETHSPSETVCSAASAYMFRYDPFKRWADSINVLQRCSSFRRRRA